MRRSAERAGVGIEQCEVRELVDEVALTVHDDQGGRVFGLQIVQDEMLQKLGLAGAAAADDMHVAEAVFVGEPERHVAHQEVVERRALEILPPQSRQAARRSSEADLEGLFLGFMRIGDARDRADVVQKTSSVLSSTSQPVVDVPLRARGLP